MHKSLEFCVYACMSHYGYFHNHLYPFFLKKSYNQTKNSNIYKVIGVCPFITFSNDKDIIGLLK